MAASPSTSLLGYPTDALQAISVYDIWEKQSAGYATGTITTSVPSHGVKLFRLGDKVTDGINSVENGQLTMDNEIVNGKSSNRQIVYDLSGRIVNCKSSNGQMPKGLYIQGNKVKLKR